MSVSEDRICRFELMEDLDSTASKNHKKGQIKPNNMPNKFVSCWPVGCYICAIKLGVIY